MGRRYLSIDVGIKNLAYCILDESYSIHEWDVISLADVPTKTVDRLVILGASIKEHFDALELASKADTVMIENQIAPIASNMKSLQCMIAQYFLMRGFDSSNIRFVSSSLKLKGIAKKGSTYKERKALSIRITLEYIAAYENDASYWSTCLQKHKKKDDMCDAYLQCVAFVKTLADKDADN